MNRDVTSSLRVLELGSIARRYMYRGSMGEGFEQGKRVIVSCEREGLGKEDL